MLKHDVNLNILNKVWCTGDQLHHSTLKTTAGKCNGVSDEVLKIKSGNICLPPQG